MNKADLSRALKAVPGKTLNKVQILNEDGEVYNISSVHFDPENDVIFIKVVLHE